MFLCNYGATADAAVKGGNTAAAAAVLKILYITYIASPVAAKTSTLDGFESDTGSLEYRITPCSGL